MKVEGQGQRWGQGQISNAQRLILGTPLCRVQQRVKKSRYQSKMSNHRADAVDWLLIVLSFGVVGL